MFLNPVLVCRARIELRDTTIRIKDGLSGSAVIGEMTPDDLDTDVDITTVVLNTTTTTLVPVGARFTVSTAMNTTEYTVTARTPTSMAPTTNITFTPAWGTPTPAMADTLTFLPQQVSITVGDGNLTYTENKDYIYELDRGDLDTVREGDQVPLDLNIDMVYEFVTTGTGETITPVDALKGTGGADEWVSSSTDPCEPYAVDIEVEHTPPCGSAESEITLFPDFRYDSLDFDLDEATISVAGRCNATQPTITRE